MSRKHFEGLAKALREAQADSDTIIAVANFCQSQNPRFNRHRFITACCVEVK